MDEEARQQVLLLTTRSEVVDAVAPLVAAVGVRLLVEADAEAAGAFWLGSPLVLVGEDVAYAGLPGRRQGVVVVSAGAVQERFWRTAMQLGADHAVVLPQDQGRLVERLGALADPSNGEGAVVAVVAGAGGAGASTFAGCLALSAPSGKRALIVDLDPLGAGAEVLLGAERLGGLRWPDLQGLSGPVRAASLGEALPCVGRTRVLGWTGVTPRSEPKTAAVESVLDAGRRQHDLVVVDLPRARTPAAVAALVHADVLVLVVPAQVRGALSARAVLADLRPLLPDIRLVVRTPPTRPAVRAAQVAEALGLPLYAGLRSERAASLWLERGDLPARGARLSRLCRSLAAEVTGPARQRNRVEMPA